MSAFQNSRLLKAAASAIVATMLLFSETFAQVDTGSIQGTVRDETGAVVPNATVTLLNVDMGISWETKTNDVGSYQFPSIRIGNYTATASDVLFTGGREGYFFALDATNGLLLWNTQLGGPIQNGPMTYSVNGRQYVAVSASNSLFVFGLRQAAQ